MTEINRVKYEYTLDEIIELAQEAIISKSIIDKIKTGLIYEENLKKYTYLLGEVQSWMATHDISQHED